MIFFDHARRLELFPKSLDSADVKRAEAEIERWMALPKAEREQSDVPPVWKLTLEQDVLRALVEISQGRCAFCETERDDLAVYRFRPPAYSEPRKPKDGKEFYLWLAFAWPNLFPICPACRPREPNVFPVKGKRAAYDRGLMVAREPNLELAEDHQLYFPGELTQPQRGFEVGLDGVIRGRNGRARLTIDHFNLNAAEIVEARVGFFDTQVLISRSAAQYSDFMAGEFGGVRYLLLRRIAARIGKRLGRGPLLAPDTIGRTFEDWRVDGTLEDHVADVLDEIRQEDEAAGARGAAAPRPPYPTQAVAEYPLLASVKLAAYKSLEDITFTLPPALPETVQQRLARDLTTGAPEAPCLLFLGENATGKSSILEAVALTAMADDLRDGLKLDARKLTLNPEYMGAPRRAVMEESRVELEFHETIEESGAAPRKRTLTLDINGVPGIPEPFTPGGDTDRRPLVFAYGAHRLYGRATRRKGMRHVDTLFNDDRQLSNPEAWLRSLARDDKTALDEVVSALRHIIQIDGHFESIEVREDPDDGTERCYIRIRKTRPNAPEYILSQRLDIVSSGYRAVFALVCDVLQGLIEETGGTARTARHSRAIVLIDEIEAHLHPRWKLQVITGLRRALPRATFLISSHDPLCIRGMFEDEVVALNRYQNRGPEGLGMPERVEKIAGLENIESLTIEQLLTSDLFQLFSTDDRKVDRTFAEVADILSREDKGEASTVDERSTLKLFNDEIAEALPFGRSEVTRIVQQAVAEYLAARRTQDTATVDAARKRAKRTIKAFLSGLVE